MQTRTDPPGIPSASGWRRWVPGTLFARVALIIVIGLAITQLLAFASIRYERDLAMRALMMTGIELDIASSVAVLNRLPAAERADWLDRLERPNYRFALTGTVQGAAPASASMRSFATAITEAVQPFPVIEVVQAPELHQSLQLQVRLSDGSDLIVHARRVERPISAWVLWALALQLVVLAGCAWLAVRLITRPLQQLAAAADALGPDLKGLTLDEAGPSEVARAARAFNAMQRRITLYTNERVEILAAISHDLQTPITRMRLRADMLGDETDREKFRQDLESMDALVREGVSYARTLHGDTETPRRLDIDALLASMSADYEDSGQAVQLEGRVGEPVLTRPHALRRILMNLIDNALKFGREVRVQVRTEPQGLVIAVLDDGPGIPAEQLDAVLQPFYRLEGSRNRSTGGTGLGLAIANQLAMAMGARLALINRPGGGLEARLTLSL
ncbi:ATP-binding protein [Paucibacter sp. M5-1]|uniref:ATP-binding protein n=1 Tax=Paucibacter sp. M5-1 TaxID=3015998 RepID=UPI0022B86368|nr:ATP-binding protein [Paucibacter sp. M5-1]MCZ7884286.1 ATP-binding protein [Paucibacter sp. M5-1]